MSLNEHSVVRNYKDQADILHEEYPEQMDAFEKMSILSEVRDITTADYYALGKQLFMFEDMVDYCSESNTLADLGKLPHIGLDLITATYGSSILPIVCTTQPIEEETGIVYWKRTVASTSRGNVTEGDTLIDPRKARSVYNKGFAGEVIPSEIVGSTTSGTRTYSASDFTNMESLPIRPFKVIVTIKGYAYKGKDVILSDASTGDGRLLGYGVNGEVDYATGTLSLDFVEDPGDSFEVVVSYRTDFEASGQIPKINTYIDQSTVTAEVWALGSEVGILKAFSLRKRFGSIAEDELLSDLTNEITAEMGNILVDRLASNIGVPSIDWSQKPGDGFSWADHKKEFRMKLENASAKITETAGRGNVNIILAGPEFCSILKDSAEMEFQTTNMNSIGPGVYGYYQGNVTVIRVPQMQTTRGITIFRGNGFFDAPAIYSPYMPMFVGKALQVTNNPLKTQNVAAIWAGLHVMNPQMIGEINITNT